ncbi:MAG: hypothetical protein POH28_13835 [Acidocella sp.]|nr:hypothetical protein [Acidocella sp.]
MILRGLWLLARGRDTGLREFADGLDGFTASLAPLIAFPLVGAGVSALGGDWQLAIIAFLSRVSVVLALPLIIHEYARRTGREALWLRTATALDWSFWLLMPLLFIAAFAGAALVEAGVAMQNAEYAALGFIVGYQIWLHWFVVRAGLQMKALAAAALVLVSGAVALLLTAAPFALNYAFTGQMMPG